jgi:hypothetical protein
VTLHNAAIVQRDDLRFDLLWHDDAGELQSAGPFGEPNEAVAELAKRRQAEDESAAKAANDAP